MITDYIDRPTTVFEEDKPASNDKQLERDRNRKSYHQNDLAINPNGVQTLLFIAYKHSKCPLSKSVRSHFVRQLLSVNMRKYESASPPKESNSGEAP